MKQNNSNVTNEEFNNFAVHEIIANKEASHETGEYNEIQITNGLISTTEEESSSSDDSTSKAISIGSSVGVAIGIGGIVVGAAIGISTPILFLSAQSIIGISEAHCFFELSNIDYEQVSIRLENEEGVEIELVDLFPTDFTNQYVTSFYNLTPNSTYYLQGLNSNGEELNLGEVNSFTTLDIPTYDIDIDRSNYDKINEQYNLTFIIDNPNGYPIEALLVCENDETLNQHLLSTEGIYQFSLPNILSSYRLELYQENFLVGQTFFSDYEGINVIEESIEIGISSIYMGLNPGEINVYQIDAYLIPNDNLEQAIEADAGPDGNILYVTNYELEPNTSYLLKISDKNRPTFTYFSYRFNTLPIPNYNITIDDSNFDIANGIYDLTFIIENPNGYYIDANLICLNDETLNQSHSIITNTLEVTLPTLFSEYQLSLTQEGHDVGSKEFSYYNPMSLIQGSLNVTNSSFACEVELGDISFEQIGAFLQLNDDPSNELVLEIVPIDNTNSISLRMEGLLANASYTLKIRDKSRPTLTYLTYTFNTLA